jgi:hypothetical protein
MMSGLPSAFLRQRLSRGAVPRIARIMRTSRPHGTSLGPISIHAPTRQRQSTVITA